MTHFLENIITETKLYRLDDLVRFYQKKPIYSIKCLLSFFFEKQTHTQGREKRALTQKHTTTPFKSHDNF